MVYSDCSSSWPMKKLAELVDGPTLCTCRGKVGADETDDETSYCTRDSLIASSLNSLPVKKFCDHPTGKRYSSRNSSLSVIDRTTGVRFRDPSLRNSSTRLSVNERGGRAVITPSYSGGPGFKSRPGDRLS
jgi:hypothetical protein